MAHGFKDNYEKAEFSEAVGELVTASAPETVLPHNTAMALCSVELGAGSWVIDVFVRFPANETGLRRINISTQEGVNYIHVQQDAAHGGMTQMHISDVMELSETTTIYLNAVQYSGVDLTMPAGTATGYTNGIRAMRIV